MKKGKIRIILALFVLSVFLFQSCMTIIRGSSQEIPVTSNPLGAKIIVDGEEMGNAPLNLKLKRKKSHVIRIEKQGYNPLEIAITRKTSISSFLGNLAVGGIGFLIGAAGFYGATEEGDMGEPLIYLIGGVFLLVAPFSVDFLSGAKYTLSPKELNVTLIKTGENPQPNFILIDAEKFQDIKWIRIKCADSDEEDIVNFE